MSLARNWIKTGAWRRMRDFSAALSQLEEISDMLRYDDAMVIEFTGGTNDIDKLRDTIVELQRRYRYGLENDDGN